MIPEVPTVLAGIAQRIMADIGPELTSPYHAFTVQLLPPLLMMIAQEFDRAAARFADENDALVELFRDAQREVQDGELQAALREATAAPSPSLLVSALRERNRVLRGLLVRLHAHVEACEPAALRALNERIWAELAASTQRRQLDLANG
ncbi:MAG: hypothetical protein ACE5I7_06780 [Candidatus Binatia bacterium]